MPAGDVRDAGYGAYRQVVHDSFARWYQAGKDAWTGAAANDRVTDFVCAAAPPPGEDGARRRVLDVGCGRGHQSAALAARLDAEVTGLDLLDVWDAEPPPRGAAHGRVGDFLGWSAGPVDLLVDNGCLHHQRREEWPGWVRHGLGLLRPGGVWAATCFLNPGDGVEAKPLADGRLNWWLDRRAFTALFTGAGFEVTGHLVIDRRFHYQGHWLKYLAVSFRKPDEG